MMKILVTGGAGFIGSHLVDVLVREGHSVVVLDNLEEQVHRGKKPKYLNSEAQYIWDDIRNCDILRKVMKKVEIIFHEAASVGVGQSMYQVKDYISSNTLGTATLLDFIVNNSNKVKKLIVASSMSVYGEGEYLCQSCGKVWPKLREESQLLQRDWEMKCPMCARVVEPVGTSEEKKPYPTSIYALSKMDQELMCIMLGKAYKIPTVALRYFNVYGPRQSLSNPYTGVCAIFMSRIKNNHPPLIYEDGRQTRDFTSVEDIVQANLLALDNADADYQVLNVGTGIGTSILEAANLLIELNSKSITPVVVNKYRIGDIRHCFSDISKIKRLGYEPAVELKNGLEELKEWGRTEEAEDLSEQADAELERKRLKR